LTYFVTGATGFIGRHLVEELLGRDGDIHVLVREGSQTRLDELVLGWEMSHPGAEGRIKKVVGDLQLERLGVGPGLAGRAHGQDRHFFHLAAIYDMTAGDEVNERMNVAGTRNAVALANALQAGHLHHTSSIAVAGLFKGLFREDMFAEGQKLPSAYHRTKYESEAIVRKEATVPSGSTARRGRRALRDRRDGQDRRPVLLLPGHPEAARHAAAVGAARRARARLDEHRPGRLRRPAMDHIAHQPDLDGEAFHLTHPKGIRSGEVLNAFAAAAHAPQMAVRIDKKLTDALPKGAVSMLLRLPQLKGVRDGVLGEFGIPGEVIEHVGFPTKFDTRDTERALRGTDIDGARARGVRRGPVGLLGAQPRSRPVQGPLVRGGDQRQDRRDHRRLVGHRQAAAMKIAAAGGIPILVARGMEKLEAVKAEIEAAGGTAYVYSCDLSSTDAIGELCATLLDEHAAIDFLVNNAGRSIRRSMTLSHDRFHDFERTMQLNYFGTIKLVMGLIEHMKERGSGHIVNISSIGVQTRPPRFAAYVASKSALDAWTRCVSSEVVGRGVTFTTIHMPLVKTPMIAPTKMYDAFPTLTPDEAGDMVCEALRAKPKEINTKLGTFGAVAYSLMPKAVDQILHVAYKVFPDSAAAKGQKDPDEKASMEQLAMANLMKGVHW
jgi:NAD(P)-dependent dehydrogenase (short-subunit alcohol dehydrogenase family)